MPTVSVIVRRGTDLDHAFDYDLDRVPAVGEGIIVSSDHVHELYRVASVICRLSDSYSLVVADRIADVTGDSAAEVARKMLTPSTP
jgi:hypothetical protein